MWLNEMINIWYNNASLEKDSLRDPDTRKARKSRKIKTCNPC
jgi:hypothetical protein